MLNDRQSGIFNKLDLSKNPNQSKLSFVDQEKSSDPKMLYRSSSLAFGLRWAQKTIEIMFCDT